MTYLSEEEVELLAEIREDLLAIRALVALATPEELEVEESDETKEADDDDQ